MAGSNSFFAAAIFALMAIVSVAAVSAQELSPAPAPSPDAGAGLTVGASAAVIFSSLIFSVVHLLRN